MEFLLLKLGTFKGFWGMLRLTEGFTTGIYTWLYGVRKGRGTWRREVVGGEGISLDLQRGFYGVLGGGKVLFEGFYGI